MEILGSIIAGLFLLANTYLSFRTHRETKSPNGTRTAVAVYETNKGVSAITQTVADLATAFATHTGDEKRHAREQTRDVESRAEQKGP